MKITNEKFERKLHIFAQGKGKYAEIRIKDTCSSNAINDEYELDEAKEILRCLAFAIEDCEKRSQIKDEDDE